MHITLNFKLFIYILLFACALLAAAAWQPSPPRDAIQSQERWNMIRPEDEEFYNQLIMWIGQDSLTVPVKFKTDGTIDRKATLEMECYVGMPK